jgi:nucleotide-binding universal stress UspA family protein
MQDVMYNEPGRLIARTRVIMLPVDGSKDAARAASVAFELAEMTKARLLIVHVINLGVVKQMAKMSDIDDLAMLRRYMEDGRALLENYKSAGSQFGLNMELIIEQGFPSDKIVQVAKERRVDVIERGSRGATGEGRVIGSTTERVVRGADCAVLVIKSPNW